MCAGWDSGKREKLNKLNELRRKQKKMEIENLSMTNEKGKVFFVVVQCDDVIV